MESKSEYETGSDIPQAWLLRADDALALQLVANAIPGGTGREVSQFLSQMVDGDELWHFQKPLSSIWDDGIQQGYVILHGGRQKALYVTQRGHE